VDAYAGEATATVDKSFTWLPPVLVVSMHRTADKYVEYVAELDASGYVQGVEDCRYSLCAVSLRRDGGEGPAKHLVMASAVPGEWNVLGPGRCEPVAHVNDIIQKDASLLLYRLLL
jgi:hypothetical protein